jgi:streptomycin 6-kinase
VQIPEGLKWLQQRPEGKVWLAALPHLLSELIRAWQLELGAPFENANVSYVVPAIRGAEHVVLKVQWPHEESAYEAEALRAWDGDGAVKLLAYDENRHALLLEQCRPGTTLAAALSVDPIAVVIDLLPRLWKPAGPPFKSLSTEAKEWSATLYSDWETSGSKCERSLVDAAAEFIEQLTSRPSEYVLVHQDLHGDNVIAAERQPWLAIDPKPLLAEREFSLAPVIRSFEFGHSRAAVIQRLDRLSVGLGLDRERVRGWTIVQTVAWSFSSGFANRHYETARWLMAA